MIKLSYDLNSDPTFDLKDKGLIHFRRMNTVPEIDDSVDNLQRIPYSWNNNCFPSKSDYITLEFIKNMAPGAKVSTCHSDEIKNSQMQQFLIVCFHRFIDKDKRNINKIKFIRY